MTEGIVDRPVRRPDFFSRTDNTLVCRECGQMIDHIPGDWLEARIGDSVPCPGCAISSRIPTRDESAWEDRKAEGDPMKGVPLVNRDGGPSI